MKKSYLVFFGSCCAVLYLKVDQIMIGNMIGMSEVGRYAIAAQLSEAAYFLPGVIAISFFPKLVELRDRSSNKYESELRKVLSILFYSAVLFIITMLGFGAVFIKILGGEYAESLDILYIHVFAAVFIFLRAGLSKWIVMEELFWMSLYTQAGGAVVNVLMNLWLIPSMGGVGAAIATVVSYAVSTIVLLVFVKRGRSIFYAILVCPIVPFKYFRKRVFSF